MQLIEVFEANKNELLTLFKEFDEEWLSMFWNSNFKVLDNIDEYINLTKKQSRWEVKTKLWWNTKTFVLISDDRCLWIINIRDKISGKYLIRWGNVGYAVRLSERWKWYGVVMLELALKKAKKMWLNKVLITCDYKNIASSKIIEKVWWILENIVECEWEKISRYYISLKY
jgi:predicted acetyltransferase